MWWSPNARTVPRALGFVPTVERRSVTRSLADIGGLALCPAAIAGLARDDAAEGLAAPLRELGGGTHAAQTLERRARDVDRIRRAERLGQDVADAGRLDDGAHRAAGDDAGALGGGLQEHRAGAELLADFVRHGRAHERHLDEVLLGVLDALADGLGHLAGLAEPDTDVALAIADDDDGAEAEAAAAL